MNQNIKDCRFIHSFKPSIEESKLFHSYRAQLGSSFNIYRQNNLALTNQENELRAIKIETEMMFKSYEIQKRELEATLENTKREIEAQKIVLKEVTFQFNKARQRLRYYMKKQTKICQDQCQNEES